mmetsp:Transcript_84484/g.220657  ORF Transcript_84484/g.220657 Transcript_84484/m.220657 type:complete len:216 (-) Transcript_84484:770-1417(-)
MSAIIFSISSSTTWKGFSASRSPTTRESTLDLRPWAALRSSSRACCRRSETEGAAAATLLTAARWKNAAGPVPPELVAATFPKVAKAASLLRMATAWEMAASSLVRSCTRDSYSLVLVVQISPRRSRNCDASVRSVSAVLSCSFMVPRPPSLALRSPCFSSRASPMVFAAPSRVSFSFSYAVAATCSTCVASSTLAWKVSIICLRIPTTSPDWEL